MTDWTDAEVEQLAEPSASDAEEAKVAWRTDAPPAGRNLADAETQESD